MTGWRKRQIMQRKDDMKEDIVRMAKEAGLMGNELAYAGWYPEALERFAELVAAAEREACAKVCEKQMEPFSGFDAYCNGGVNGLEKTAAAIRARSNT